MGATPFGTVDPSQLPAEFLQAYEGITPFEERAGIYAGTAYDAMQFIFAGINQIEGEVTRTKMTNALQSLEIEGMTGTISLREKK